MSRPKNSWHEPLFIGLVFLLMVGLGLSHHIFYSIDNGGLSYFKSAYDEDFYGRFDLLYEGHSWGRHISSQFVSILGTWFGGRDHALIFMDGALQKALSVEERS